MARVSKSLQPLDRAVQRILADAVKERDLSYRAIADSAGMSLNRVGIILRGEQPPATLGELDAIARLVGMTATRVVAAGEDALRSVDGLPDEPPAAAPPAPHATTVTAEDIAAGALLPRGQLRQRRTQPSSDKQPRTHT